MDAFRAAMAQAGELRDYASYYITARLDAMKVSARNAGLYAALGVVGFIALAAMLVSGVVLLCWGCAGAISAIWGIWWLGHIIMGAVLLLMIGVAIWIAMRRITKASRQRTKDKYEEFQHQQRAAHGHDVPERANQPAH